MYSRAWEYSYKLNDQPVRERVTASLIIIVMIALVLVFPVSSQIQEGEDGPGSGSHNRPFFRVDCCLVH